MNTQHSPSPIAKMLIRTHRIGIPIFAFILMWTCFGIAQSPDLGIFTDQTSVGQTPPGSAAHYDIAKGEYRITGGGANVWGTADAFYFVWKKASGDITLTADVQWVGTSSAEHRKALLMVRQSLDPGSVYADAVSHGNGLTSLQFRGAANEQTYQIPTQVEGTVRLRIEKKGSRFTMYAGKPNEELKLVGPVDMSACRIRSPWGSGCVRTWRLRWKQQSSRM